MLLMRGWKGRSISATFPGNTAAEFDSARLVTSRWLPGRPAQEQAEAQSGSRATSARATSTTEARPASDRAAHNPKYALIHRSAWKGYSPKFIYKILHSPGTLRFSALPQTA